MDFATYSGPLEAFLSAARREEEIHCPYCDCLLVDEEHIHVTFWGEDEPKEATCPGCERSFLVKEHVRRTYSAIKIEDVEGGEA